MKTVLAFFAISVVYAHAVFTGYYWRDYDASSIPCDAIQGGTDSYGHYTYIGLIALSDPGSLDLPDMVSATIYKGDKYAYSAYHSRLFKSDRGVKILCSADSKNVRWSKSLGNGCTLVRGSYTANYTNYYIGRTIYNGKNVTGRFSTEELTLYVPWTPEPLRLKTFKEYEMLMYCNSEDLTVRRVPVV
uniref:Uncharacterized protein n=1 Tax=Photinus pyralis TaxID=7054 RepID=A0A1Y1MBW1_PHOPY